MKRHQDILLVFGSMLLGTVYGISQVLGFYTKSPSFVYLCWLLVILLDVLKCTPASIPRRHLDLLLNATWYYILHGNNVRNS